MIAAIKNAWSRMLDPKGRDEEYQKHLAFSGLSDELMTEIYEASGASPQEIAMSAASDARHGYEGDEGLRRLRSECEGMCAQEVAAVCCHVAGREPRPIAYWILEGK